MSCLPPKISLWASGLIPSILKIATFKSAIVALGSISTKRDLPSIALTNICIHFCVLSIFFIYTLKERSKMYFPFTIPYLTSSLKNTDIQETEVNSKKGPFGDENFKKNPAYKNVNSFSH